MSGENVVSGPAPRFHGLLAGAILALLAPAAAAASLSAQTIRGQLVEKGTETPIKGAFVVLLDDAGSELTAVLTDDLGRFVLEAPRPGRYRLRADRIGYESTRSPLLQLQDGEELAYRMLASVEAVQLAELTVEAERECVSHPEEGLQTAALWEEARKALEAASWTEKQRLHLYEVVRYTRELDAKLLTIRNEQAETLMHHGSVPFVTPPAEQLTEAGFVQNTAEGTSYYAPDAEVLLSDAFVATHCFRVEPGGDRDGLVGLAFEPVEGRDVPDVNGVLWLDESTAELRHLEYQYSGLQLSVPTEQFGGRLEFERLPSGAWIIRRWWIRGPIIEVGRPSRLGRQILVAVKEEGGQVTRILPSRKTRGAPDQSSGLSGTALRQRRRRTDQAVPLVSGFGIPKECPDAPIAFGETPTI